MKGEIRIRVNKKHARIKQFFKPVIRKNQTNDLIEKILRFVINFFFLPLQERFLTTQNPFQFVPGYRGSSQFPILLPPNRTRKDFLPRSQKTTLFDRFTALSCCPIAMRGGSRVVAGGQSLFVCRDNFPSSLSLSIIVRIIAIPRVIARMTVGRLGSIRSESVQPLGAADDCSRAIVRQPGR